MKQLLWGALALTLLIGCELPMAAQLNNPLDAKAPGYSGSSVANLEVVYYSYPFGGSGGSKFGVVTLNTANGQLGPLDTAKDVSMEGSTYVLTTDTKGRAAFAQPSGQAGIHVFSIRKSDGALLKVTPDSDLWYPTGNTNSFMAAIDPFAGRFLVTNHPSQGPTGVRIGITNVSASTAFVADFSSGSATLGTSNQPNRIVLNTLGTFGLIYSDSSNTDVTAFRIPTVGSIPVKLGTGAVNATTAFPTSFADPLGRFVYAFSSTGEYVVASSLDVDPALYTLTDDSGGGTGPAVSIVNGMVVFEPTGTFAFAGGPNAQTDILAYKINNSTGKLEYWSKSAGSAIAGDKLRLMNSKFSADGKYFYDTKDSAGPPFWVYKYSIDPNGNWSAVSSKRFPHTSITYISTWDPKFDASGKYVVGFYTTAGATWLSCHDIATGLETSRVNVTTTLSTPAGTPTFTIAEIFP